MLHVATGSLAKSRLNRLSIERSCLSLSFNDEQNVTLLWAREEALHTPPSFLPPSSHVFHPLSNLTHARVSLFQSVKCWIGCLASHIYESPCPFCNVWNAEEVMYTSVITTEVCGFWNLREVSKYLSCDSGGLDNKVLQVWFLTQNVWTAFSKMGDSQLNFAGEWTNSWLRTEIPLEGNLWF